MPLISKRDTESAFINARLWAECEADMAKAKSPKEYEREKRSRNHHMGIVKRLLKIPPEKVV